MSSQQITGVVLLFAALMDVLLGLVVVGPRIANPDSRRVFTIAMLSGATLLGALGIAFLSGAL